MTNLFSPHSSSRCFRHTAAFAAVRTVTSSFCTEKGFIEPKLVPRLDRREPYLSWLWLEMDTHQIPADPTFISFVRAVAGFGVPQKTHLEYIQVWSTPSDPFGWMKDYCLICFIGKSVWHIDSNSLMKKVEARNIACFAQISLWVRQS